MSGSIACCGFSSSVRSIAFDSVLAHWPEFYSHRVGPEIVQHLKAFQLIPTLLFADPFGYMGISLRLLETLLLHSKSEAIIFFNTNRINAGVSNEFVREHIDALFGSQRADAVRRRVRGLRGDEREKLILESFAEAVRTLGFLYVLQFRFLSPKSDRTSHHLIHCSRHPLGEKIMKDIMDRYSLKSLDGVPMFQIPNDESGQLSLFITPFPPLDLANDLVRDFAGKTIAFGDVFRLHSPGKPYVERNYRDALSYLVDNGKITCSIPKEQIRMREGKRTWPKTMRIVFPAAS